MDVKQALHKVREAFRAAPLGFSGHDAVEYCRLFDMEPHEALVIAEAAVRGMQQKRSLDDYTLFELVNELGEKVFVYNLLLQAIEQNGEVNLTDEDIAWFRKKTMNCCLADYGGYVSDLRKHMMGEEKRRLPKGVWGFSF